MDKTGVVDHGIGPGIQVRSGGWLWFLDPRPEDIVLSDIAGALSKLCRYTGHTTEFYSVAQHSVMASKLVPKRLALAALLHDAAEAYIGDVSRPLKTLFETKAPGVLREIENRIHSAVNEAFGIRLNASDKSIIKAADNVALATEKRDLLPGDTIWPGMPEPLEQQIEPLEPHKAEAQFMRRYRYIVREMG